MADLKRSDFYAAFASLTFMLSIKGTKFIFTTELKIALVTPIFDVKCRKLQVSKLCPLQFKSAKNHGKTHKKFKTTPDPGSFM